MNYQDITKKIISFFKEGKIENRNPKKLEEIITETYSIIERDIKLIETIKDWYKNYKDYYLVLPEEFFPKIKEKEKRKKIKELKLNREETSSQKIIKEKIITPHKLFKEGIEKVRKKFDSYSFFGISWRWQNKNKLILTTELIEGYLLFKLAKEIIKVNAYFDKNSIEKLIDRDEFQRLKRDYKIYRLTKPIEEIGGILTAEVPSRTREQKYKVWIKGVPLSEWKIWPGITIICNCESSGWHVTTYIRPKNEEFFCAHGIAAYWAAYNIYGWQKEGKISLCPFFEPSEELIKIYRSLKKNVFYEDSKSGKRKPLSKAKIELLLNRAIILGYNFLIT